MCNKDCEVKGKCTGKCYTELYGLDKVIGGPEKQVTRVGQDIDYEVVDKITPRTYLGEEDLK
jgi:hypothetical protein